MAYATDSFAEPTSRIAAIRLRLAKALPALIFAAYLLLYVRWDSAAERLLYSAMGGLLFQLLPLLLVVVAYFFVCWVAGVDSGRLESNPFESKRLLAGMVALAALWAWDGYQRQVSMRELTACVEERVEYGPQEPIRYIIVACREGDGADDDAGSEF